MTDNSNFVAQVDAAFAFIMGISLFFLVAITAVLIYFVIRYRRSKNPTATQIEGSNTLEIVWTVIPTIIVLAMFYYGWAGWHKQEEPPADAMKIKSIARMWHFSFQYPNGRTTDTLYVPLNKPVALNLVAMDVIHSIYIPAFRLKKDMVPGDPKVMWFESGHVGNYDIYCAEYCGLNHSYMLSTVKVLPKIEFDKWYNDTTSVAQLNKPVDSRLAGLEIIKKIGCVACHSTDGVNLIGPTFKNLYKSQRQVMVKGTETSVVADEAYLKESILNPAAKVVKGFNNGLMLSYKDQLNDEQIDQIIAYFKTLSKQE
jgi:cytochrome c oxidase subunit 2